MNYIKVKWVHSFRDEPVFLYSELDEGRWEIRKVEVFSDGRMGYADSRRTSGGTKLGKEPVPSILEIGTDPQFEPMEVTKDEFETIWSKAVHI